jgi:acetyl-CoA carboxylase biotin carboxyl carrier protein
MLSHDDVREILRIIDESELEELVVETEGFSLHVSKGGAGGGLPTSAQARPTLDAGRPPSGAAAPEPENASGLVTIASPMLGTFYRAESPGADPFVDVGFAVESDTTVCIIEVMKMMNSVPAGVSGTVEEIVPANGELVEYGAPLFRVRPPA